MWEYNAEQVNLNGQTKQSAHSYRITKAIQHLREFVQFSFEGSSHVKKDDEGVAEVKCMTVYTSQIWNMKLWLTDWNVYGPRISTHSSFKIIKALKIDILYNSSKGNYLVWNRFLYEPQAET